MISLLFEKDLFKVLTVFSLEPGARFKRVDIKEKTLLNNVPLDNTLLKLIKAGLIKKEGKLYSVNFENEDYKQILNNIQKQYKTLKEIPLNAYFLIIDFISSLNFVNIEVYLFGSYSKLIFKEDSDIDIAIIGTVKKETVNKIVRRLEKKYKKSIEVHYFDKESFYKNKSDPLVKDIIKNGVKLT